MTVNIQKSGGGTLTVEVGESSIVRKEFPATDLIALRFWTETNVEIPVFSYIEYSGRRFYSMGGLSTRANKNNAYEHSLEFYGYIHWTRRCLVMLDGEVDFPFRGTLGEYADLFQQNMRRVFGSDSDCEFVGSSNRIFERNFSGQSVYEAAILLAEEAGCELEGYNSSGASALTPSLRISSAPLGRTNHISNFLSIGSGISEFSISQPTDGYANRVYAYGASKNLDFTSYGRQRLISQDGFANGTIPVNGLWETARVYEDIYPSFTGTVTSKQSTLQFGSTDINFDVNSQLLTESAKVSFLSGDLVGYTLEMTSYDHANRRVIVKQITDDIERQLPGSGGAINIGDKFTFLDIEMPQSYIDTAESVLEFVSQEEADRLTLNIADVSAVMEKKWFVDNATDLALGDEVNLAVVPSLYGFGRVIRIEHPITDNRKYNCIISKTRNPARLARIQIGLDLEGNRLRKEIQERKFQKYNNR